MEEKEKIVDEILSRGVAEVIDRERLKKRLLSGEKLRIKLGIDPTSPHIHLGRAVTLLKLRDFQSLGHQIVFIVGDFTGQVGDASDKESERPMLAALVVAENMRTYSDQVGKLIDMKSAEVHYNSEWLSKLGYEDISEQANHFSLAEFINRENIRKRLDEGKRVSLREVLYPLMQGYDSIACKAQVEIGGTDQRFNLLAGRHLQEAHGLESQDILLLNLIPGTDSRKMSSSWGNTINLTDEPNDMFGKIMSIPDDIIETYFIHCTRVPLEGIKKIMSGSNPRDAKLRLAEEIVALYHGKEAGSEANKYFIETISEGKIPANVQPSQAPTQNLLEFLVLEKLAESKSDARRKVEQGGVEIDGKKITDWQYEIKEEDSGKVIKVGKKDFREISNRK